MVEGLDDHLIEEANLQQLARGKFRRLRRPSPCSSTRRVRLQPRRGRRRDRLLGYSGPAAAVGTLLRAHQREHAARRPATAVPSVVDHRQLKAPRNKLAKNVAAWSIRSGSRTA